MPPSARRCGRLRRAEPAGSTEIGYSRIKAMRAEIQAVVDDIKKSLALLRRHL